MGRGFAFRILQTITGMREELYSYLLNLQGLEVMYEKNLLPGDGNGLLAGQKSGA